jgi:hypothetical protein
MSIVNQFAQLSPASVVSLGGIVREEEGKVNGEVAEEENVIYIDSFFIPRLPDDMTLEQLVDIIQLSSPYKGDGENDNSIGVVEKIESIPKISTKDGKPFKSAFVTLRSWCDNQYARSLMMKLYNDEQSRVYYNPPDSEYINPKFIVLLPNKSEISLKNAPNHIDLVLYLHTDTRLETVLNVIEGLDIGRVHSIESILLPYTEQYGIDLASYINVDIWNQIVKIRYNEVHVVMDYWYKTQTAYAFQDAMKLNDCVNVPVCEGTNWTIYRAEPKLNGINPYVWNAEPVVHDSN